MKSFFTSDFFIQNRARLRQAHPEGLIVIAANGLLQRKGDTTFPFSQDANFWYLTGIDEPDMVLVMDEQSEYLIVPIREGTRAAFDGSIDLQVLKERSGVSAVLPLTEGWGRLEQSIMHTKIIASVSPPPAYIDVYGIYVNPARSALHDRMNKIKKNIEIADVSPALTKFRMTKQAPELMAIKHAIAITADTLMEVIQAAQQQSYNHEYEIEAAITSGFRKRGATGHAFDPIVANGKNATTIHYLANNGRMQEGQFTVIDIGAEVEQYAADITRTVGFAPVSPRHQAVFDAVEDAQAYAQDLLKPGVLLKEYEQEVERYMGKKLLELKLISTQQSKEIRKYYPHAASHHLGLNVHDVYDREQVLEPGMVLTVEPGIYIPEKGIGVRLEDDVLIAPRKAESLSATLPTQLN